jgi:hypothetical protein
MWACATIASYIGAGMVVLAPVNGRTLRTGLVQPEKLLALATSPVGASKPAGGVGEHDLSENILYVLLMQSPRLCNLLSHEKKAS